MLLIWQAYLELRLLTLKYQITILSIFDWSGSILIPPKRGGKRHNLASTIKKRICSFSHSSESVEPMVAPPYKRLSDDEVLAQAIASKLEDGNIRTAIRILCSDDTQAKPDDQQKENNGEDVERAEH